MAGKKGQATKSRDKREFDYEKARRCLVDLFTEAEKNFLDKAPPVIETSLREAADALFSSETQSFREGLLGCGLARLIDRSVNIRHPYKDQGEDSFNGRTLDEKVVNPFLHDRLVPCSNGPYLAVFRRGFMFIENPPHKVRDKSGYAAFLKFITRFERTTDESQLRELLRYLLFRFVGLRNASDVSLAKISRISLDQYSELIRKLIETPSGGLIPVLLTTAMFSTIKDCFSLDWEIESQGINVADKASRAGGDITIKSKKQIVLAIEVTERPIDKSRVVSTFNTKISRHGIEDYLFLFTSNSPTNDARTAARTYFAQGHEMNFLEVGPWLMNTLGTIGGKCRGIFTTELLRLLQGNNVPAAVKVRWNDLVKEIVGV